MKLEIELIPKNSWYKNLRNNISKREWDKIRKKVYKKACYECEVCKNTGLLYCHERWNYDDINKIQKLIGFSALCENCHYVNHLGLVNIKIASNELPEQFMDDLIDHFCKVNDCSKRDFEEHRDRAYNKWIERSKVNWNIDFRIWKDILKKKQATLIDF